MERFTFKDEKYYDKDNELTSDDVTNLLNDDSMEISRLLEVITGLHQDIRNQAHRIRQQDQLILQLNDIIDSYQIIYQTLRER